MLFPIKTICHEIYPNSAEKNINNTETRENKIKLIDTSNITKSATYMAIFSLTRTHRDPVPEFSDSSKFLSFHNYPVGVKNL